MSFSKQMKTEICEIKAKRIKEKEARLLGIILPWLDNINDNIVIKTESESTAFETLKLIKDLTGNKYDLSEFKNSKIFTVKVKLKILPSYFVEEIVNKDELDLLKKFHKNKALKIFFVQGLLLGCGRISNPQKEYRLEIVFKNKSVIDLVYPLLHKLFPGIKAAKRNNNFVIYTKDSETIERILTYTKAIKVCFEIINAKIYKELRNNVNRVTNCDGANIDKTIRAANLQIKAILNLREKSLFESVPVKLKKIAKLRLDYPQVSIKELADISKMTKSIISYSLNKLIKLNNRNSLRLNKK